MKTFTLNIVSSSKIIYSSNALYCSVTTIGGSIGFEAFHEPFLGVLKDKSEILYKNGNGDEFSLTAETGMVSFFNNTCTVTVSV